MRILSTKWVVEVMNMRIFNILLLGTFLFNPLTLWATFNDKVSVQAYLKQGATPLNDAVGFPMQFIIKKNGVAVWCQQPAANIPVNNGLFSMELSGASNCSSLVNVLDPTVFYQTTSTDVFS